MRIRTVLLVLPLLLTGCAVTGFLFGPSKAEIEKADVNKDGVLSEQERKDADLPVDGSPWIETALQVMAALSVPGAAVTAEIYRRGKASRAMFESVVSGVDQAVKFAPEIKDRLYVKLKEEAVKSGFEDKIAAEVERVKQRLREAKA